MQNCIIVEDDYLFALDVKIKAEEIGLNIVRVIDKTKDIDEVLLNNEIDIILSDIKLGNEDYAYDYFKNKKDLPPIIFFTGYDDEALYLKSKKSNPYVYLIKPFDTLTLRSAVDGALATIGKKIVKNHDASKSLMIKSKGEIVKVKCDEIIFVKSEGNYCKMYTLDRILVLRSSIAKIESMISLPQCFQVHRAYLINADHISSLSLTNNIITAGEFTVPIGRKYKKILKDKVSSV